MMLDEIEYKPNMSVVRSARNFIANLCEVYGSEQGMAVWDHIRKGLGEQIASDIFLGMLTGQGDIRVISIGPEFISAIKEVRWLTGWGLKEAKDFCDAVRDKGPQVINIDHLVDDTKVENFVNNMRKLGCRIE